MSRRYLTALFFALPIVCLLGCQKKSPVEQATEQGILIMGNSNEPKGLDPHLVSGVTESKILRALFEGLCRDHESDDGACPGGAAESYTANENGSEWTFKLRKNAKWSDGKPVTSEDFLFAYQRMLSPDLAGPYAEMLFFMKGAEAYNKGETADFSTVGVKAPDPHTLIITLRGPTPYFPQLTKHFTWYPVPKHIILKYGDGNPTARYSGWTDPGNMVSNGPYKLKSWRMNHSVEVERNPHYWDAKEVTLDGVRFLPINNLYTESRMFADGQLHITGGLAPENVDLSAKNQPQNLRQEPYVGTLFYRCNTAVEPLNNPLVREALNLAIDRKQLTEKILKGFTPATSLTPPMAGYTPPEVVEFNPKKAAELLSTAGYPGGNGFPNLKVLIASRETARTVAEAVQAEWKTHLGIHVEIENKEWAAYLTSVREHDYQIAAGGWIGDYLDPTTFLEMWTKGNGNNNTQWSNEEYESLLKKAQQTPDLAARAAVLREAESIFLKERPILPLAWYSRNYLMHPAVKNYYPLLLDNHPYQKIRLEPQANK